MVVHLDDVPAEAIDRAVLRGTRWRVGPVAGCARVGLSRYRLGPGERAMPVHVHADEEELFVVLAGAGLSWQDGGAWAVTAGDVVLHRAGGAAHTIVAAEAEGLDVLAFGSGSPTGLTWLPRAGAFWAGPHWVPPRGRTRSRPRTPRARSSSRRPSPGDRRRSSRSTTSSPRRGARGTSPPTCGTRAARSRPCWRA